MNKTEARRRLVETYEATGHYWLAIYHSLLQEGFTLVTVNPLQVHAYRRSTIRKVNDDRRDAWAIADLLRIGRIRPGYVPSPDLQTLRDLAVFGQSVHKTQDQNRSECVQL